MDLATDISAKLQAVRARIAAACTAAGRDLQSVKLVTVTKAQPAAAIEQAVAAGASELGENYLQEALTKRAQLKCHGVRWHFIGPIQSNKTRDIAAHFDWVHSVDRLKIAQRLSEQRPEELPPLNICLQVNISGEASKAGVAPEDLLGLAQHVSKLPRLCLRGLMAIPEPATQAANPRQHFVAMRGLCEQLRAKGLSLDTLSMGMSDDFELAIAEGSTLVRVGSAIFGARPSKNQADNSTTTGA